MRNSNLIPFNTPTHKPSKQGHRGTHGRGWKATTGRTSQGRPYKYGPVNIRVLKAMDALLASYDLDEYDHDMLAMMAGIA